LTLVLVVIVAVLGWLVYAQRATKDAISAQTAPLADVGKKLGGVDKRLDALEEQSAKVKAQAEVYAERLGLTRKELDRAEALTKKYREEQLAQLGLLTGEIGAVKETVAAHGKAIEETRSALQRAIGDLGEQSGLIARNYTEVQELKKRGERDYFDFDLKKSKQFDRIGPIAIRLRSSDAKRSKFTLTLLADDKEIEKKDKTLLEPVQFYLKGKRQINEMVVYEITKDRVIGYLSVPKEMLSK
jgi:chromosome segregation ATPase